MKDTIFRSDKTIGRFRFDREVADVFDDMLTRSVPFYSEVQKIVAGLAADYYKPGTNIYDLGCSTGTTEIKLCKTIKEPTLKIIGVDSSGPVIEKAKNKIENAHLGDRVELIRGDIMDADLSNASVVIMNYILQFIPPETRGVLLEKIHSGLIKGGILLLSEKVLEDDTGIGDLFVEKHHNFKKSMGYSELEISKKREALEDVLIPFTVDEELRLLRSSGFSKVSIFFKWFNFASFIAIKG